MNNNGLRVVCFGLLLQALVISASENDFEESQNLSERLVKALYACIQAEPIQDDFCEFEDGILVHEPVEQLSGFGVNYYSQTNGLLPSLPFFSVAATTVESQENRKKIGRPKGSSNSDELERLAPWYNIKQRNLRRSIAPSQKAAHALSIRKKLEKNSSSVRWSGIGGPFSCDACEKTFTDRGNLRRHTMRMHDAIEPKFTCPYACDVKLWEKSIFDKHMQKHKKNKRTKKRGMVFSKSDS